MRFATVAQILDSFSRTMGDIDIRSIRPASVDDFLRGSGGSTSTWHRKYGTLKSFFRFAIGRGYATSSPLPVVVPQRPPEFRPYIYSTDELRRIIAIVSGMRDREKGVPRSSVKALILLLYGAGLRISEALSLKLADVDLQNAVLTIREGKFYKSRLVPFGQQLAAELGLYAHRRGRWPCNLGNGSPFFAMRDGRALNRHSMKYIWRKVCDLAGVRAAQGATEQPRLHDLRHSFAVHRLVSWYKEGADVQRLIYFLQIYLGHDKLAHTQHYLTMTPELLDHANQRFATYVSTEVENVRSECRGSVGSSLSDGAHRRRAKPRS
ncbi:MAG: tyrosine-type recombinase/integrase [Bradyrhizobium sp.]|nr:tyrosine-type recombinase/integrase [Bradyrhizobium sp.]